MPMVLEIRTLQPVRGEGYEPATSRCCRADVKTSCPNGRFEQVGIYSHHVPMTTAFYKF